MGVIIHIPTSIELNRRNSEALMPEGAVLSAEHVEHLAAEASKELADAMVVKTLKDKLTAGGLSRLLHYVAERLVAIYLELGEQLSDSEILGGDDTSCRVLEVSSYFEQLKGSGGVAEKRKPPWSEYGTTAISEERIKGCEEQKRARRIKIIVPYSSYSWQCWRRTAAPLDILLLLLSSTLDAR